MPDTLRVAAERTSLTIPHQPPSGHAGEARRAVRAGRISPTRIALIAHTFHGDYDGLLAASQTDGEDRNLLLPRSERINVTRTTRVLLQIE